MSLLSKLSTVLRRVCSAPALSRSLAASGAKVHPSVNQALWGLGRLNHVAVVTPDIQAARTMYKDIFGATVSEIVKFEDMQYIGSVGDPEVTSKLLQPLPEHGVYTVFVELPNTKIELLHPLGEKSPVQAFLDKNKSGGMHHLCIEVDDIETAIAELKKRNVRILGDGKTKIGAHGLPVVFLHPKDCGGVLIELELAHK